MQVAQPITECLVCQGPVYDNRGNKKNPKGPDFKCKNANCQDEKGQVPAYWLPKGATSRTNAPAPRQAPAAPRAPAASGGVPAASWAGLRMAYQQSFDVALKVTDGLIKDEQAIVAATATIFIQAMKANLAPTGQIPLDERPPALDNQDDFEG